MAHRRKKPGDVFDLTHWKLTIPDVDSKTKKAKEVNEASLIGADDKKPYSHKNWFFVDNELRMVFTTPNQSATTKNSKNTRSELREMVRGGNKRIKTKSAKNNWVIGAHPNASTFGAIGGTLKATLSVDHVSLSGNEKKYSAHAVVVGQIHGSGKTEPLKIYYRKLPSHKRGSIFWNYESRPKESKKRKDIVHNVFGSYKLRSGDKDPEDGIELGEPFSYKVCVKENIMHLRFKRLDGEAYRFEHDLSKPHPKASKDLGYANDWLYFKAGAYNQSNPHSSGATNKGVEAGDFARVSFSYLFAGH